jgi:hypothetical protein
METGVTIGVIVTLIAGFVFWWWRKEDLVSFFNKILPHRKIIAYFDMYKKTEAGKQYIQNNHINNARIKKAYASMKDLIKNKRTEELDSDIYYLYLFSLLTGAKKRIWAISVMGENEWNESSEEIEFQRLNIVSATRKDTVPIRVERIFLVDDETKPKLKTTKNVKEQIECSDLHTYMVNISTISRELEREIGNGFLAFDDYAVAEDVFADDNIRGKLFIDRKTIKRYENYFTKLKEHADEIDTTFLNTI